MERVVRSLQNNIQQAVQRNSMEACKGNKNYGSNKFIIKPKGSITHMRSEQSQPEPLLTCSQQEIDLFLAQMIQKSKRFKDLIADRNIDNEEQFYEKYLYRSISLKTILKTIIDKMISERRLGKNLKGLNKSNLAEIQAAVWQSLIREVDIYKNEKEFYRQKEEFQATLARRKEEIRLELEKIKGRERPARHTTSYNQIATQ